MKNFKKNFKSKKFKFHKRKKIFKTYNIRNFSISKPILLLEIIGLLYLSIMLISNNFNMDINSNMLKGKAQQFIENNNLTTSTDISSLINDTVLSSKDIELLNNNLKTNQSFNNNILDYTEAELNNRNKILIDNYTVDKKTGINMDLFDFNKFINTNFNINIENKKPKILIFHTHGSETYIDSKNLNEGVMGLGALLKDEFENVYGIPTLHITERFDLVDGKTQILGAYERMNNYISEVLKENPSIEVVLDIHRDGLPDDVKIIANVDGKATSPIMFVNGLTSLKKGNSFEPLKDLVNPNLKENLAFSFKLKAIGNSTYPTLFKKIYLHAYRYSLHFKGKSLLIEVGAQTNTWEESKNSIKPLAKTIASVLK